MPEEKEVTEEVKPTFIEEMREKEKTLRELNERMEKNILEMKNLRAEEILSGKVNQATPAPVVEESPQDYLNRVLQNKL